LVWPGLIFLTDVFEKNMTDIQSLTIVFEFFFGMVFGLFCVTINT